jgi:hypothetical protein
MKVEITYRWVIIDATFVLIATRSVDLFKYYLSAEDRILPIN